jgi:hypothetical protein
MHPQQIKLILADITPRFLYDLLIQHFAWEKSPDYPVYVYYKVDLRQTGIPDIVNGTFHTFRIGEATGDENYPTRELAQIVVQSSPPFTVLVIQKEGEDKEADSEDWVKVESLVRKIIARIQQSGSKTVSAEPPELIAGPDSPFSPDAQPDQTSSLRPKTEKTLIQWRQAYAIVLKTRKAYLEEYKDGLSRKAGRMADYRDAIAHEMGWAVTERTLRKIIQAGEAGLLE